MYRNGIMAINSGDWCNDFDIDIHGLNWLLPLESHQQVFKRAIEIYSVYSSRRKDWSTNLGFQFCYGIMSLTHCNKMAVSKEHFKILNNESWQNDLTSTSVCYLYNLLESHLQVLHRDESRPTKLHAMSENSTRFLGNECSLHSSTTVRIRQ